MCQTVAPAPRLCSALVFMSTACQCSPYWPIHLIQEYSALPDPLEPSRIWRGRLHSIACCVAIFLAHHYSQHFSTKLSLQNILLSKCKRHQNASKLLTDSMVFNIFLSFCLLRYVPILPFYYHHWVTFKATEKESNNKNPTNRSIICIYSKICVSLSTLIIN